MMDLKTQIQQIADTIHDEILEIRRHLHQNPELSFQEYNTSKYLKDKLKSWGVEIDKTWVNTGFTVCFDSKNPGPCIGLRADLDALPIFEKTNVPFKSNNDGIMHACGHDVHAACLMGVAKILASNTIEFLGKIVLIFQPGEEKLPGGASLMIEEGLLETYPFDAIIAQHVYPEMEAGKVGFKAGMYMASADEIYLTIHGKGGHAALPHKNIDPIVIASSIIVELQQISSRVAPPTIPTVLSFGKIEGLGATNVIPDIVRIEGTLRTMDESWRSVYHDKIKAISESIASSYGGTCDCDIRKGYPFLINEVLLTKKTIEFAHEYLGKEQVENLDLRMTAEDFAYYSQKAATCFYRLGVGNKKRNITQSVHHPEFDVDESAIKHGVGLMAFLAIKHGLK